MKYAYGYDEVFIEPQYSDISSRKEVDTSVLLGDLKINVPVMTANMDTITEHEMAITVFNAGGIGSLHRFFSIEKNVEEYQKIKNAGAECFVSIGVNTDYKNRAKALYDAGARFFIIDIAHGHSLIMKQTIEWCKKELADSHIMAGNVATSKAVLDLQEWGANSIKCGVGPGCFAAGTRILMANATYKNIEDIQPGEFVINKNGKPVKVLNAFTTGIRKVVKLRTNHFYKSTFVTPEHQYWIGDLNSTSKETISSKGYACLLDKKAKTIPKTSKYKWHKIGDNGNFVSLLPRNIEFNMPATFNVELKKKASGNWRTGFNYETVKTLTPSYELGYIFGTFLGDGNVRTPKKKAKESNSINWFFGAQEHAIANKLACCLDVVFQKTSVIKQPKNKNILQLSFGDKPFADFLSSFGKKSEKHLPETLLINDEKYLTGIYDGLIDSDGNISKDNRYSIHNTSNQIIELYNVISFLVKKHFPLNEYREPSIGGLKNVKVENFKPSYVARNLKNYKARLTKDYQVVKIMNIESQEIEVKVYDLEVDCETHSFIANNSIVHNSVCLTKDVTGVTKPQFSAILECVSLANVPIIADGGIKSYGDIAKAIGAGATAVMSGYLFAGTHEIPSTARLVDSDGSERIIYRGMASKGAMERIRTDKLPTPEGKQVEVHTKSSAAIIVDEIQGALRSSYSYCGARNTAEFQAKVTFGTRMPPK